MKNRYVPGYMQSPALCTSFLLLLILLFLKVAPKEKKMHSKRIQTHEDDIRAKKANPKEKDCEGLFRKSEQTGLECKKKESKKKRG